MKYCNLYLLDGEKPVLEPNLHKWEIWIETADRHVANDKVGEVEISTVFLGLDHRFSSDGAPVLFETMVFGGKLDGYRRRYCTWEEAETGHAETIEKVKFEET